MPTMRQLVTSNPGSSWMRTPNYQQQVGSARAQFPSVAGAVGYGGSMASNLGNQVGNANRAYSLGIPNAASHLPSNMGSFGDGRTTDVNELRNQQSALRSYMEMTPGLNQGLPEFAGQRADLSRQRDALQTQIDSAMQSQWAENQARISNRAALRQQQADQAKRQYETQGRFMQSTPQSMIGRADQAQRNRYMPEGGGQPAQWGWDGGSATFQPLNDSARGATFGPLQGPSQSFQQAQAAQRQAYQMPAQQSARTRQMIYGYGGV